jgi:hypothetical protein
MNERKDHKEKEFQYKHTSAGDQLQSHKQTKKTRIREHPSGVSVCAHCALRHGGPVDDNTPDSDVKAHEDLADGGCCSAYSRVAADAEFAAQLRPVNHEHKAEICKYLVRNFTLGFLEEENLLWSPFVIGLVYFKVEPLDCCEATSVKLEQALLKALEKYRAKWPRCIMRDELSPMASGKVAAAFWTRASCLSVLDTKVASTRALVEALSTISLF